MFHEFFLFSSLHHAVSYELYPKKANAKMEAGKNNFVT